MGYILGIAAILTAVAGTAVTYEGQQYNAAVAKNTADYNAKLQENQALQAEMDARENARRQAVADRRFRASQRAAIGKSGISEAGSPLEVLGETAGEMQLADMDAARQARLTASQYRSGAANTLLEGAATAQGYKTAGYATLLSGASQVAGSAYSMNRAGTFSGGKGKT